MTSQVLDEILCLRTELARLNTVRIPELINHGSELLERARAAETQVLGLQIANGVLTEALGNREWEIQQVEQQLKEAVEALHVAVRIVDECGLPIAPSERAKIAAVLARPDTIPVPPPEHDMDPSVGDEVDP